MRALDMGFYNRDPLEVAPELLGSLLVRRHPRRGELCGRIVEVEAYRGPEDLACHASKGRTARNATLWGPPGHAYVYLIYGMYDMFNTVTWRDGYPSALLVRAIEPLHGFEGGSDGPGKLSRIMEIDRRFDGAPLDGDALFIARGQRVPADAIRTGPRVGVDYAGEWASRPWRYWIAGNAWVSKAKGARRRLR